MLISANNAVILKTSAILLMIFLVVLASILLIRVIARILLHFARKKYQNIIKKLQQNKAIKAEKVIPKIDDELLRTKESPQKIVEKINTENQEEFSQELDEVKIIDIVKPVGFWTSMILGQKLTYLVSSAKIMNKNSHKGFWMSMVEAQEKAAGRQRGRSL